jgi:hypothetical protein
VNPFLFPYVGGVGFAFVVYVFLALRIKRSEGFCEEDVKLKKSSVSVSKHKKRIERLERELFATKSHEVIKRKRILNKLKKLES